MASSGFRLPPSTTRKPSRGVPSSMSLSSAALMRRPAVTRMILRPENIGRVCSSTARRPVSSSRSVSSRRSTSPGGFSRAAIVAAICCERSVMRPGSDPKNKTADNVTGGDFVNAAACCALMATIERPRYAGRDRCAKRRVRSSSPTVLAARFSAFSRARTLAKIDVTRSKPARP